MIKVFIYGSCVTRDAEPLFNEYGFEMVGYVARQSLISAFRPAKLDEYNLSKISSSFQRRMSKGDIQGNLRFEIQKAEPDIVVWDICDERLGVKKAKSGGMITDLRDHVKEGIHAGPFGKTISFGDDEHFELWTKGLHEFSAALNRYDLYDNTYLNATPWAKLDEQGGDFQGQRAVAEEFNRKSVRYIDLVRNRGIHVVSAEDHLTISRTNGHQWGPAPFHYVEQTYRSMLENLRKKVDESTK